MVLFHLSSSPFIPFYLSNPSSYYSICGKIHCCNIIFLNHFYWNNSTLYRYRIHIHISFTLSSILSFSQPVIQSLILNNQAVTQSVFQSFNQSLNQQINQKLIFHSLPKTLIKSLYFIGQSINNFTPIILVVFIVLFYTLLHCIATFLPHIFNSFFLSFFFPPSVLNHSASKPEFKQIIKLIKQSLNQ